MKVYISSLLLFISGLLLVSLSSDAQGSLNELTWGDISTCEPALNYIPPPAKFTDGIRTASFDITFTGYSTEAQSAFQYAADIWSSILLSNVPVKINTYLVPLLPGLLGITLPNGRKDFNYAPKQNTWYASSLANSLAGVELNVGEFDMDLYLNSNINWYYGTDGNCPLNKFDLVSVVLHEICHGLGFVGLGNVESNIGSFGLLQQSDFAPLVTSFPWPVLDTLPGIYDYFLENNSGEDLTDLNNPSADLAGEFTGNALYWNGSYGIAFNGNNRPRLYAPASFTLGSSLLHLNESTYPPGNVNELMTPSSGPGDATHDPGPIVIGMLKDIGWQVNYNVGIQQVSQKKLHLTTFPVPASSSLSLKWDQSLLVDGISILNVVGQPVFEKKFPAPKLLHNESINISHLPAGYYLIKMSAANEILETEFVKQ